MALESAMCFLNQVKSDETLYNRLASAKSTLERRIVIENEGFLFTEAELYEAKSCLSDWELTMLEDTSSFRSDKRVAGLEMCCCCRVGGGSENDEIGIAS